MHLLLFVCTIVVALARGDTPLENYLGRASHYEVLGISQNASTRDIRAAWREKTLRWHPDKLLSTEDSVSQETANIILARINFAYETLKDTQSRRHYDHAQQQKKKRQKKETKKKRQKKETHWFSWCAILGDIHPSRGRYCLLRVKWLHETLEAIRSSSLHEVRDYAKSLLLGMVPALANMKLSAIALFYQIDPLVGHIRSFYVQYLGQQLLKVQSLCANGHVVVFAILMANLIMFAVQTTQNKRGVEKFAINRDTYGWQRLFTSSFTHGGVLHLLSNMSALVEFGPRLHIQLGYNSCEFICVYVVAAYFAGLVGYYLHDRKTWCWGASGAIYGVIAAELVLYDCNFVEKVLGTCNNVEKRIAKLGHCILQDIINRVLFRHPVSWQSHLGGAIGGGVLAYTRKYLDLSEVMVDFFWGY